MCIVNRRQTKSMKLPHVAVCAALLGTWAAPALANGQLASHRAVYDMRLDTAATASGIAELVGRMVFEFRGSQCEGYTQHMRLVTRVTDNDGNGSVSDMRTSSWEEGSGKSFRFDSTTLRDARISEKTSGKALQRSKGDLLVNLGKPVRSSLALNADVMFPVRHTQELLTAANEGRRIVKANVYDGSEQGRKYFETTSIVGNRIVATGPSTQDPNVGKLGLASLASWPVSISYYDAEKKQDEGLPTYQMAFRFFENGVTRDLKIDYGTFRIDGTLSNVTYFEETPCEGRSETVSHEAGNS